ncbi:transmembrane protease serine 11D-like isoform X2 [Paramacrobiotus metropolitanus]|uniref:transmembrane protease serine 11D-like isoform X2 n=1 Tax=Paramacrobiotus metropolitanus TaxID=2943436 RepID=UPI002446183D|nr:transmembrane protease serine 11D-like isoform X2 [Paramacrobiotus metropolitanus]
MVKPGEFPFMVSLRGDYGHFCGGILLTPTHVLTAASCFIRYTEKWSDQLTATTGILYQPEVFPANTVGIQRVIYHADFHDYDNNIAVIKLTNATTGSLPGTPRSLGAGRQAAVGHLVTAVGWRITGPQHYPMPSMPYQLYKTQLRLAKPEECSSAEGFGNGTGKLCAVSHNLTVCKNG